MLTEERMQELAEQFEDKFSAVSFRILRDIGETLKKTGDLTPAQAKKLQQMFTYGADVERMTKMLAQASGESMEAIQKLYEQVAREEQDWSKPFYDTKEITQIPLEENELLQNIIKAATAVTKGDLRNMSRTTTVGIKGKNGFEPLGSFYKKTVDEAITAVSTGTMDYNSVIRQAIKDMGSSGLRVRYESGYTKRLDSAIRQNILDGVSYIAQETAKQAGEEFGADGVELSAHSPSAPDHLPYQGKQYSLKEYDELQKKLERPIGEWNCRHFPYPILLGISRPANSKEELAEMQEESNRIIEIDGKEYTRYECTQMQRKLETKLRYAREEKAIYQAAGQEDLVREATEKMRILGNKYKEVSDKAGLPTRAERMRVFRGRKDPMENLAVKNMDYMSNSFRPKFGKSEEIELGKIKILVKKVQNSEFELYADASFTDRNMAVRLNEKVLREIQKGLPTDFDMPQIVVIDFDKYGLSRKAIAGYNRETKQLFWNEKYSTKEKIEKYLREKEHWFASVDLASPWLHEFGHKEYYDAIEKLANKRGLAYNKAKEMIDRRIYEYIETKRKQNADYLSENFGDHVGYNYPKNNFTEVIAECNAAKETNKEAMKIMELLKEE